MTGSKPASHNERSSAGEPDTSKPKMNRKQTGQAGEDAAASFLHGKGYRIVARNWRCRTGELDMIAEHNGILVFIEVRTRRPTGTFGTAKESVNARKQQQVRETAQFYLYTTKQFDAKLRFDVIAIELPASAQDSGIPLSIEHIENAF